MTRTRTSRTVTITLAGGALSAALAATLAAPASAARPLPVEGGTGSGTVEAPMTRTPTPTMPTSPLPTLAPTNPLPTAPVTSTLTSFTVSIDSVVGTARIRYTDLGSTVTVRWGDGAATSFNPTRPIALRGQTPGDLVFQHIYAEGDGTAKTQIVSVQAGNATDFRYVTVTPRYQVTQGTALFAPMERCEPAYEFTAEWKITRKAPGLADQTWRQDRPTNAIYPDFWALANSSTTRQLTVADGPVYVTYRSTEIDTFFDDDGGTIYVDLNPKLGTRQIDATSALADCTTRLRTNITVSLLKPGLIPSTLPVLTAAN